MYYVYDDTRPLAMLRMLAVSHQNLDLVGQLAQRYPEAIYFWSSSPRDLLIKQTQEFLDTIKDSTQAMDIAWTDYITEVHALFDNPQFD